MFCDRKLKPITAAGIVNPIEAKVRKGKGAVGAYGNERTQQSLQDFPVVDSDEEEEKVLCERKYILSFLFGLENNIVEYISVCVGVSEGAGTVA